MAVLIVADVQGQTHEGYERMLAVIGPELQHAPGFIAHGAGPSSEGWKTFEVWESQADATAFFLLHVHPHLPPGVRPKRTFVELDALVLGPLGTLLRERERETATYIEQSGMRSMSARSS